MVKYLKVIVASILLMSVIGCTDNGFGYNPHIHSRHVLISNTENSDRLGVVHGRCVLPPDENSSWQYLYTKDSGWTSYWIIRKGDNE